MKRLLISLLLLAGLQLAASIPATRSFSATENFVYDAAGRLKENSGYKYSWDAEDRLLAVETKIR